MVTTAGSVSVVTAQAPVHPPMGCTHGVYGIAISCSALMPGKLSIIAPDGGCACVDRSSADATEIVVAATNTAKIIERIAFSP